MSDNESRLTSQQELLIKAKEVLNVADYNMLSAYIAIGRHPLSPDTAAKLFELFLNGSDINEIHRLNKNFPYEAILWARIKYDWDKLKDEYAFNLTNQVAQKVIKASLETTSLLTDMLAVAHKKHGDKLKKFLQTGDESDLGDALSIDTIHGLLKAVEGLQKVTGQDRTHNINKKEVVNLNVSVQGVPQVGDDTAKTIIAAVAKEKMEKMRGKNQDG